MAKEERTMTLAEYDRIILAGRKAKEMIKDNDFAFFRDWIKNKQYKILERIACDLYKETTVENIGYDEASRVSSKATTKTTKAEALKEARESYLTLIEINDFLVFCIKQAEQAEVDRKTKVIKIEEGQPEDDPDIEYVG